MDILSRGKMKIVLLFLEFMHVKYIVMRKGKIVIPEGRIYGRLYR